MMLNTEVEESGFVVVEVCGSLIHIFSEVLNTLARVFFDSDRSRLMPGFTDLYCIYYFSVPSDFNLSFR